ncbi:YtsA [Staphylococcus aureus]|uniref:Response regulator protein GraR n=1 Tax=Staphylococcus aureus TaxID=1280 RepID=A0A380E330_STAAU|nr:YtsA [Staphylococcus aureus]
MGFNVAGIEDFGKVMDTFESFNPEIVILDVQLPKYDGFYWCRKMREVSNVPILFLSSRDNPMDQVMSMELGADDYMQKPFYTNVLIAKLQAIYRRVYEFTAEEKRTLTWQDAIIDLSKDSIQKGDDTIFSIQNRNDYIRNSYYQKKSNRFERYNYHCIMG